MSVALLNDSFWDEDVPATLHGPTVLQRIRHELSEGKGQPITIAECFAIAQTEMRVPSSLCLFLADEIGRPLFIIGAVWGHKRYGIPANKARSLGCFLGSYAGGDAVLGGAADKLEKQAAGLLRMRLAGRLSLDPDETNTMLDEVIAFYQEA